MAVIQTGSIVSDIRGSVGEETYSRNQGGLYVAARSGPSGEPSANQLAVTAAMTALSAAWSATLSDPNRETWRTYGRQFPTPNRWGKPTITNGYCRFIAVNFPQYIENAAIATLNAPTAPPINMPNLSFTATTAPDEFTIPAPVLTIPAEDSNLWIYTYIGVEQPAGVSFYANPFTKFDCSIRTLDAWQAADLVLLSLPAAFTTAKKIWLRQRIQCATSFAISTPGYASAIFDA